MQAMFADPASPWHAPWMMRVLPNVERIARRHPDRTIFTRFVPLPNAEAAHGSWRGYYRHWHAMTRDAIDPAMIELLPSLVAGMPEAEVLDKTTYGPWYGTDLDERLRRRGTEALVVTGGETDVCLLGAVMGAIDRGLRVVIVVDAICSSSDEAHDAMLRILADRYPLQVEFVTTAALLGAWA